LHARWLDYNRRALELGLLVLDGSVDEASIAYRACLQALRDLGCFFDVALAELDFVTLAPDYPAARAGADEAREIFERIGAKPFVDRLEAAMSSGAGVA
jgi:hypothetical protein